MLKIFSPFENEIIFKYPNEHLNQDFENADKPTYFLDRDLRMKKEELTYLSFYYLKNNDTLQYLGKYLSILILKLIYYKKFQISKYENLPFLCRDSVKIPFMLYIFEALLSLKYVE